MILEKERSKSLKQWRLKMQKIKRILSGVLVFCMVGACTACGQIQKGSLPDQAAVREFDANQTEIYIDDNAIALAEQIPSSENMDQAAQTAFALMNQQRAAAGLAALAWNQGLADAAKVRAGEIISLFAHKRPNGSDWWTVNSKIMYGENLAKLYQSADSVTAAWMASPTHKANIMDAGFKTCGISIVENGGKWYWAQEFGY